MKKFLLLALMMVGISASAQIKLINRATDMHLDFLPVLESDDNDVDYIIRDNIIELNELRFPIDRKEVEIFPNGSKNRIYYSGDYRIQFRESLVAESYGGTHVVIQEKKDSFTGEISKVTRYVSIADDGGLMKVLPSKDKFSWYFVDAGVNGWAYLHVQWGSKDCFATVALFDENDNFLEKVNVSLDFGVGKSVVMNANAIRNAKYAKIKCSF